MRSFLYRRLAFLAALAGMATWVFTAAAAAPTVPTVPEAAAVLAAASSPVASSSVPRSRPVLLIDGTRLLPGQGPGGTGAAVLLSPRPASRRSFTALIGMKMGG